MRTYDASAGTIYFDGVAIKDIPLSVLRTRVSYTPQKSFLFTGTVADNLRFADPDASDEALWRVLSIAQATEFITQEAGALILRSHKVAATFQVVSVSVSLLRVVFCARLISTSSTIPSRRSTSRLMHACAQESRITLKDRACSP